MTDKTNEEKLKILQERLSAIKQKETTRQQIRAEKNKPIAPVFEEELVSKKPNNGSFWKIIFFLISFSFTVSSGYYLFKNDFKIGSSIDNIKNDLTTFSKKTSSLFGENDKNKVKREKKFVLKYNFNIPGDNIAITGSFKNRRSAKAMVNYLKRMGEYKCDYFFLPDNSNSTEEIYKVFIGPYESEEETNQEAKDLEVDIEIIKL